MDVNRVIGEVAARHGVRLDPDDPALVLVTVAEMMLAEAREEFLASARRATAEFVEAAGRVQENAGAALAAKVLNRPSDAAMEIPSPRSMAGTAILSIPTMRLAGAAMTIAVVSFLVGLVIGGR